MFDGEIRGDSLVGRFKGGEGEGTFAVARLAAPRPGYREEEVRFTNGAVQLAGTLLLPLSSGHHPALVFVHGSGPEGRHGSRFLADYLARHGVAALIFDKRGVGGSGGDWRRATLEELADDALAGLRLLRGRPEVDSARVGIYGHSQGGLVAPLAASRSQDVGLLIAGATYGGVLFEQDLYRVENSLEASEFSEADQRSAMAFYRRFIEVARTGQGMEALERAADSVRHTGWYEWLGIPPGITGSGPSTRPSGTSTRCPRGGGSRSRCSCCTVRRIASSLSIRDIRRIGRALDAAGNRRWSAVILPRAAHNFTVSPRPGEAFEWRRVANGLPELVLGWIRVQAAP